MAKAKTKIKAKTGAKTGSAIATRKPATKAKAAAKGVTPRAVTTRNVATTAAAHSASSNKEIYRQFVEQVLNAGNYEVALRLLDPVVVSHSPLPEQQPGAAGFIASLTAMRKAFPDLHALATHFVAEGDLVAARFQVSATHSGDFFGIRATGRKIHYEEQAVVRFAGGRIVEHWAVADGLSILQQLGGDIPH
jgi:predicted ester cyclase